MEWGPHSANKVNPGKLRDSTFPVCLEHTGGYGVLSNGLNESTMELLYSCLLEYLLTPHF